MDVIFVVVDCEGKPLVTFLDEDKCAAFTELNLIADSYIELEVKS